LDVGGTLNLGLLEIVFVFLFVDMFDNIGTLVAVGTRAGLFDHKGRIPRVNRILTADALASMAGALCGTSTVVSYIESAAGVVAGGRTGVTAIVCGLLFAVSVFVAPLFGVIPAQATAPALIVVGALMLTHTEDIEWHNPVTAIPAFLTLTAIPLTFSIANGLAFGFTAHTLLKVLAGEWRKVNWLVYLLTALFLARFFYLGRG
jgi:AGZA family xanthine/uracil permease-like MFS transporter